MRLVAGSLTVGWVALTGMSVVMFLHGQTPEAIYFILLAGLVFSLADRLLDGAG